MKPWALILVAASLCWPAVGQAKKSDDYLHRYEQVWRAAVRLIRVDQGYPIRDRDEGIGYLLFDYKDDGRSYPGSIELIRIKDRGRDAVRVAIQIPAMPSYIERMLLDKLEKKLVDEYGEAERPSKPKPEPAPEAPDEPDEE
ncbi:MAG: hypothetical protein AAF436_02670 [Myxococcota bacterium]